MLGIILKLLTYVIIGSAIYFGIKRIINDWREQFRKSDQSVRDRDLKERERPDVMELKKDEDGVFRPNDMKPGSKTRAKSDKDSDKD